MQNDLENLLRLIEKSFNTTDLNDLRDLEKEISEISSKIKDTVNSPENTDKHYSKDDLEKLEKLIEKISLRQDDKKKFLSDFQNFIKNRKIN